MKYNSKTTLSFTVVIFSFILLIYNSCTNKTTTKPDYIIDIDIKKANSEVVLSEIIDDDYKFIKLETNDNCLIGRISKVVFTEEAIFVLDNHIARSLFMFDRNGKFISTIGKIGEGPGEFSHPTDFIIDNTNEKILILDMGVRILEYDIKGNYLKTSKLTDNGYSATLFEKTNSGFAFISGGKNDNLILSDIKFNQESSYFPFRNRNLNKILISPLQNIENNLTIYRQFLNDTIYKIEEGKPLPHIFLNFNNNYSTDLFSLNITKNKFSKILKNGNSCIIKLFLENTESVFFAFGGSNNFYIGYYSKITNQLNFSSMNNYVNDISFDKKSSYVVGTTEDKFIFYVHPNNLLEGVEKNKETYSETDQFKKALSASQDLTKKSNPILLVARLKTK
jgi:hypothetical protein